MALSNKTKTTPPIKKSYSLKFDEIDFEQNKSELKKIKERNSLDNLSNSIIDDFNESNSSFKGAQKSFSKTPFKIFEEKNLIKNVSNNAEVQCNLDEEFFLKESDLTEEELEIKTKNPNNYWKIIAEKLRVDLYDNLQENMEVS